MTLVVRNYLSLNYEERPLGAPIKYLVLHYTACDFEKALWYLVHNQVSPRVSSHYLIDVSGEIYRLVPEDKKAWHAGVSGWEKDENLNNLSIGIEIVNLGHTVFPLPAYPPEQMQALKKLCLDILKRHPILPWHVLGHSDIRPFAKADPGEHFNWKELAKAGIGLWYQDGNDRGEGEPENKDFTVQTFQHDLKSYGYNCPQTGTVDENTQKVIQAFQRHFSPARIDGYYYKKDHQNLLSLLKQKKTL